MRYRDTSLTIGFCASLALHAAVAYLMLTTYTREFGRVYVNADSSVQAAAMRRPALVPVFNPPAPDDIGQANGRGEYNDSTPGDTPMAARQAEELQALLSRATPGNHGTTGDRPTNAKTDVGDPGQNQLAAPVMPGAPGKPGAPGAAGAPGMPGSSAAASPPAAQPPAPPQPPDSSATPAAVAANNAGQMGLEQSQPTPRLTPQAPAIKPQAAPAAANRPDPSEIATGAIPPTAIHSQAQTPPPTTMPETAAAPDATPVALAMAINPPVPTASAAEASSSAAAPAHPPTPAASSAETDHDTTAASASGSAGQAGRSGQSGQNGAGGSGANAVAASSPGRPIPQSDSDSDPFSKAFAVNFQAGRVDARTGRKIKTVRPDLSLAAMYDLAGGANPSVTVKARIDETGAVTDVSILTSSGVNEIDLPCLRAVQQWWIDPARDAQGKPIKDVVVIRINFR
jgi:TonB family protein